MRTSPKADWRNFVSEEYSTTSPKSFVWLGTFHLVGPLTIQAIDRYAGGRGLLTIRFSPLIDVGTTSGPESDISELIRFFNEMTWFPTSLLDPSISWTDLGNRQARATVRDHGLSVSATLTFGERGELISWTTDDRFALIGGRMVRARWTTRDESGRHTERCRLPDSAGGAAVYSLPGGDYHYIDIFISEIEFIPPSCSIAADERAANGYALTSGTAGHTLPVPNSSEGLKDHVPNGDHKHYDDCGVADQPSPDENGRGCHVRTRFRHCAIERDPDPA